MRKWVVLTFVSLDGVMQAPGGVIIASYKKDGEVKLGSFT